MRKEVVAREVGWLTRFLLGKEKEVTRCHFDNIAELLEGQYDAEDVLLLYGLKIERKTPAKVVVGGNNFHTTYGEIYHFVMKDDSGQINVQSSAEALYSYGYERMVYSPEVWSRVVNAREGDVVGISCGKYEGIYELHDLVNSSLEEKSEQSTSE